MKINFRTFTSILLFGTLFPIIIGVAFYGMRIFNIDNALFQFVSFGFIGSLIFSILKTQKYFNSLIALLLLFVGLYFLTGAHFFLSHIFYDAALTISVFIYALLIFDHLETARYLRPLILATILSIFFVSNTFILSAIFTEAITSALIFKNMLIGLLIGAGIGIGIEVGYLLADKEKSA